MKKGFTLIELLAVIAVLGILGTIVGVSVTSTRKKANIKEAKEIEKMITDLGQTIYTHERISVGKSSKFIIAYNSGGEYYIGDVYLKSAGYLDSDIKNPSGGENCKAYLIIGNKEFRGLVDCPNLYSTGQEGNIYQILDTPSGHELQWDSLNNSWND